MREPKLEKRNDWDSYRVTYYAGGKRRFRSFKEESEAQAFLQGLGYNQPRRSAPSAPIASSLPIRTDQDLREAAKAFTVAKEPRVARYTLEDYAGVLARLIRALSEGVRPGEVTVQQADTYLVTMVREGLSPVTANTHRRHLAAVWKWMEVQGLVGSNVWSATAPFRVDPRAPALVPPAQVAAFLEACTPGFRLVAALAIYAGLRRREIADLTWFDVDLTRGWILVRTSKSHKPRRVPIHPELRTLLEASRGEVTSGYVSPGRGGERRYYRDTWFNKATKAAAAKVGLQRVTFHGLRATCATLLASAGVGETAIRDLLGHHDTSVTKVYLGLGGEELQAAVARLKVPKR